MAISSNSETSEGQLTELTDDDLERISGGLVNVSLTLVMAEDSREFRSHELADGTSTGLSGSGQQRRSRFGLQFSGTFQSMGHFNSFLSRLSGFWGGR